MRLDKRVSAAALAAAGAAVLAVPALAAERSPFALTEPLSRVSSPERLARAQADAAKSTQDHEQQGGPFHPLIGEPDYGSADAAFGAARSGHVHAGQDVFAPAGTPLVAVSDGVVAEAGSDGSQGNYVYLYDPDRRRTYVYMHMTAAAEVATGDRVKAGERVGAVGCTGSCWGDHLHFEVHAGRGIAGEPEDPLPALRHWTQLERPR